MTAENQKILGMLYNIAEHVRKNGLKIGESIQKGQILSDKRTLEVTLTFDMASNSDILEISLKPRLPGQIGYVTAQFLPQKPPEEFQLFRSIYSFGIYDGHDVGTPLISFGDFGYVDSVTLNYIKHHYPILLQEVLTALTGK